MVTQTSAVDLVQPVAQNGSTGVTGAHRSGDGLLLDADSEQGPTLSVVMPTLNEDDGIAEVIELHHGCEVS